MKKYWIYRIAGVIHCFIASMWLFLSVFGFLKDDELLGLACIVIFLVFICAALVNFICASKYIHTDQALEEVKKDIKEIKTKITKKHGSK